MNLWKKRELRSASNSSNLNANVKKKKPKKRLLPRNKILKKKLQISRNLPKMIKKKDKQQQQGLKYLVKKIDLLIKAPCQTKNRTFETK